MTELSFILFVTGKDDPKSIKAVENIDRICKGHKFILTILDLIENPHIAKLQKIIATPLLIKTLPEPPMKFIGDLSNLGINSLLESNNRI
jgi:circadian clock protein KaiB